MSTSFCERFEQAWRQPTPAGLAALLHEDVVLRQPHLPPIRGRAAAQREFERLFRWIPGARSRVQRGHDDAESAFIEHQLEFPVGRDLICLPAVDRFSLRDGLALERVVYFDQLALIGAVLRHPSLWPGFPRYRLGRGTDGA